MDEQMKKKIDDARDVKVPKDAQKYFLSFENPIEQAYVTGIWQGLMAASNNKFEPTRE
jgi:hypothetical protein